MMYEFDNYLIVVVVVEFLEFGVVVYVEEL